MIPSTTAALNLAVYFIILIFSAWLAPAHTSPNVYWQSALLQLVLILAFPAMMLLIRKSSLRQSYALKKISFQMLVWTALIGISAIPWLEEINYLQVVALHFPSDWQEHLLGMIRAETPPKLMLVFFSLAIVPAICEESFFRGFFFSGFGKDWGTVNILFLSSLLFALFHLNPVAFLPAFFAGMIMGLSRSITGSILPPILIHFMMNSWTILIINSSLHLTIPWSLQLAPVPIALLIPSLLVLLFSVWKIARLPVGN